MADAWLPLEEESAGTQQLFRLAPLVLDTLFRGGVLVMDELEASFHPLLALQIIRTFNDQPEPASRAADFFYARHQPCSGQRSSAVTQSRSDLAD